MVYVFVCVLHNYSISHQASSKQHTLISGRERERERRGKSILKHVAGPGLEPTILLAIQSCKKSEVQMNRLCGPATDHEQSNALEIGMASF